MVINPISIILRQPVKHKYSFFGVDHLDEKLKSIQKE